MEIPDRSTPATGRPVRQTLGANDVGTTASGGKRLPLRRAGGITTLRFPPALHTLHTLKSARKSRFTKNRIKGSRFMDAVSLNIEQFYTINQLSELLAMS